MSTLPPRTLFWIEPMTRYEECLGYVRRHVAQLREAPRNLKSVRHRRACAQLTCNSRDVTFRERLIKDALDDAAQ